MSPGRALVVLIVALTLAPHPTFAQKPRAERPTYQLGDKWILDDGAYELIRIEKDVYVFAAAPGREIHLTRNLGIAKIVRGGTDDWEFHPALTLPWPMEVGKFTTVATEILRNSSVVNRQAGVTTSVDAYEEVEAPAGRLRAFRVTARIVGSAYSGGGAREFYASDLATFVMWYAPEARRIVRAEGSGRLTLPSFQVVALETTAATPLQVLVDEPRDQARLSTEKLVLAGKATSAKGVTRITVTLNGREVAQQEERRTPKNEMALRVPVTLVAGRNVLLVTATDGAGETRQEARVVFYDRAPPVTAAAPKPAGREPSAPFEVKLISPAEGSRFEHADVGLAGMVGGGRGVSRVVVTLNGGEVARFEERAPVAALPINVGLALREGPNTLVLTATEAGGTSHQEVRTFHYDKAVPLGVAISYPADHSRLTQASTVVVATAASSRGLARVAVTLNGVVVHEQREKTPQRSTALTLPVQLQEGVNVIVVSAAEPDGTVRQELRTVVFDRPQVAAAPTPAVSPSPPAKPDRWAVVIGVGQYQSPDIPQLRYAAPDAEAIYRALTGPAGFPKKHVLLLTDKTERKPTLRNIKWALGTFLARSAKKEDTVLIFFAGHGAPEVDQRGVERDGLAKYLVPADADPDDLYSTALPMDELQTIFGRIESERVVAFLDSCYSGAAGGRTFTSKKTRSGHLDDLFLERLTRSKGRAIVTASRPSEVSIELAELGHGIFTYYLIQGLQGAADLNRDGIVSLQELYEYVEQQVRQKARAVGGNQHPVMKGELEGMLPLLKVGGR